MQQLKSSKLLLYQSSKFCDWIVKHYMMVLTTMKKNLHHPNFFSPWSIFSDPVIDDVGVVLNRLGSQASKPSVP